MTVDAPTPVVVETVTRDDKRLGTTLAPATVPLSSRNGFEQASRSRLAEAPSSTPGSHQCGRSRVQPCARSTLLIRAGKFSKATVILPHRFAQAAPQPDRRG